MSGVRFGRGFSEIPLAWFGVPHSTSSRVPFPPRQSLLPTRSMEICAFLIAQHALVVPCESGREDLKKFTAELTALKAGLVPGGAELQ